MANCQIAVRVQPRSRREEVQVGDGGKLKAWVMAPPENGRANEALVALLARRLGIPKSSIQVVRGHRSRDKVLAIEGLESEVVLSRLAG